jgi:LysM repeat protein
MAWKLATDHMLPQDPTAQAISRGVKAQLSRSPTAFPRVPKLPRDEESQPVTASPGTERRVEAASNLLGKGDGSGVERVRHSTTENRHEAAGDGETQSATQGERKETFQPQKKPATTVQARGDGLDLDSSQGNKDVQGRMRALQTRAEEMISERTFSTGNSEAMRRGGGDAIALDEILSLHTLSASGSATPRNSSSFMVAKAAHVHVAGTQGAGPGGRNKHSGKQRLGVHPGDGLQVEGAVWHRSNASGRALPRELDAVEERMHATEKRIETTLEEMRLMEERSRHARNQTAGVGLAASLHADARPARCNPLTPWAPCWHGVHGKEKEEKRQERLVALGHRNTSDLNASALGPRDQGMTRTGAGRAIATTSGRGDAIVGRGRVGGYVYARGWDAAVREERSSGVDADGVMKGTREEVLVAKGLGKARGWAGVEVGARFKAGAKVEDDVANASAMLRVNISEDVRRVGAGEARGMSAGVSRGAGAGGVEAHAEEEEGEEGSKDVDRAGKERKNMEVTHDSWASLLKERADRRAIGEGADGDVEGKQAQPAAAVVTVQAQHEQMVKTGVYVVADGDSLSRIAVMFNTSVPILQALNRITDANHIQIGQSLMIPILPREATSTPAFSTSAWPPWQQAQAPPAREAHTWPPLPPLAPASPPLAPSAPSSSSSSGGGGGSSSSSSVEHVRAGPNTAGMWGHVVEAGDTLTLIAEMYNTSLSQLEADNRELLTKGPDLLEIGSTILVPLVGMQEQQQVNKPAPASSARIPKPASPSLASSSSSASARSLATAVGREDDGHESDDAARVHGAPSPSSPGSHVSSASAPPTPTTADPATASGGIRAWAALWQHTKEEAEREAQREAQSLRDAAAWAAQEAAKSAALAASSKPVVAAQGYYGGGVRAGGLNKADRSRSGSSKATGAGRAQGKGAGAGETARSLARGGQSWELDAEGGAGRDAAAARRQVAKTKPWLEGAGSSHP